MEGTYVQKLYDRWAPFYNPTHRWGLPKRRLARLQLGLRPGDRVLDLACGTGLNFPHLRQLVGEKGKVVGLDLSPGMLEVAKESIARHQWSNVEVIAADAAKLPFPDQSFDKVICTYALNIIPRYEDALREIKRVLVPGGVFVSLEVDTEVTSSRPFMRHMFSICAVEPSNHPAAAMARVFPGIAVQRFLLNKIYMSVARV